MTPSRLVWQSFRHYFSRNLLVSAGVAVSTAVLAGALLVGESVAWSLEKITLERIGSATHLVSVKDRYFTTGLADRMAAAGGIPVAPVLLLEGSAVSGGGLHRISRVQIIGIDSRFDFFAGAALSSSLGEERALLSDNLAGMLGVGTGDALLLRIGKASTVPLNAPFVSEAGNSVPLRVVVAGTAARHQLGGFNLSNVQRAPFNVFVSLERLNRLMEMEGKANRLLLASAAGTSGLGEALQRSLEPADAGLQMRKTKATGELEIASDRIFLEEKTTRLFGTLPGSRPIMTYFVNSLRAKGGEVPYSFVSSWPGGDLGREEIMVNDWVASDLGIGPGDSVAVAYYEIGPLRQVTTKEIGLVVKRVVPMAGPFADRELMPPIPGLADAGHCREWEAGVPIDLGKIRKKDEDYWNLWKGTPKAFVSPALASELWSNRFGNATAIRFPARAFSEDSFRSLFRERLSYTDFGFLLQEVREEGLRAARGGVNFGELFLGLSFFLLLAAIILTSLLFTLALGNRGPQVGTLLQLGFTRKKSGRLLAREAFLTALPGVVAGCLLAVAYVGLIILFLNSLWWEIVRTPSLFLKADWQTLAAGALASLAIAYLALRIPLNRFLKQKVVALQQQLQPEKTKSPAWVKAAGLFLLAAAFLVVFLHLIAGTSLHPALFFLSGAMLLAALLLGLRWSFFLREKPGSSFDPLSFRTGAILSPGTGQTIAVVALFALATFLVISTGANRPDVLSGTGGKRSGTGGFSHIAETTVPVLFDLQDPVRRKAEGLDTTFGVVQFHRLSADDASCLNLNRVVHPSVLGVDASLLEGRFSFQTHTAELDREQPWRSLSQDLPGGVVPAIADQTVIQWGLGMQVGDTLDYQTETGETLRMKLIGGLAPSLFQGHVLIDNSHFLRYFPSHSGTSLFLTESAGEKEETVAEELKGFLRDHGVEITPSAVKLAEFYSVTNTYLSIFLFLGALGLALGTVGISVVLARSVMERKRELAILSAAGYGKKKICGLLISAFARVLVAGAGAGLLAALVSILPALLASGNPASLLNLLLLVAAILLNGLLWIAAIACAMVRPGKIIPSLRND